MGFKGFVSYVVATVGGLGYWPWGPGTLTSLVVAPIWWGLGVTYGASLYISVLVVAILVGWVGIQGVLRRKEKSDPSEIVVDEVIGCGIAFAPCAFQGVFEGALGSLGNSQGSLVWAVATLGIFRVLDIWKPWPIRPLESIPGPLGIILDDGVAGLMTVLVVAVLRIPLAIAP